MAQWKILKLECKPLLDGLPEVVVGAEWQCLIEDKTDRADLTGAIQFPPPNPMDYTLYQNLTEDQVLKWVWHTVNKEYIENLVQSQFEQKIKPEPETPPLPWNSNLTAQ